MKQKGSIFFNQNILYEKFYDNGLFLPSGKVFQISELSLMPGGEIPLHTQWCDEITYALSGNATVISNGEEKSLSAGQIHFIKKDCPHSIIASDNGPFRYFCLGFSLSETTDKMSGFSEVTSDANHLVFDDSFSIKKHLELLLDEFYEWDSKSEYMASACLEQIAILLARQFSGKEHSARIIPGEKTSANHTVYRIMRYVDRNFVTLTSVREIAAELNYSEYYISHIFSKKTGMNIKEYLARKKISYACELLHTSELDLERISEQLGFTSSHSFRRLFKQYVGCTPSEYRKQTTKTKDYEYQKKSD